MIERREEGMVVGSGGIGRGGIGCGGGGEGDCLWRLRLDSNLVICSKVRIVIRPERSIIKIQDISANTVRPNNSIANRITVLPVKLKICNMASANCLPIIPP